MGIVIRQSFWGSAIMYTGVAIGYLNTLIFMPKFLDMDQIGLIRLIQSNAALLIPLAVVGMGGSLVKYYPDIKSNPLQRNQFLTIQLITIGFTNLVISGLVFGFNDLIARLFEAKSAEYIQYIHISILILISQSFYEYLIGLSRSELNIIFPSFFKEVFLRLCNLGYVLLFGFGVISFEGIIYLLTASYFLILIIFILFVMIRYGFRPIIGWGNISSQVIRGAINFSAYSLTLSIGISIISNVGFLLTSAYLGLEANGVFTICAFIGIIIEMPKRATNQILGPLISDGFKNKDIKHIENLYQKASINLGIISILLAIGIITNLQDLFNLIPKGDQLSQGFFVVVLIGTSKVVSMFFGPSGEILMYSDYKKYMLYFLVLSALLMIALNVLLIPIYGLNGAALAAFFTVLVDQFFRFAIIKRKLGLQLFNKGHIKLLTTSLVVGLVFYFLPFEFHPILSIGVRSVLITVFFITIIYWLGISIELRNLVNLIINKIPFIKH